MLLVIISQYWIYKSPVNDRNKQIYYYSRGILNVQEYEEYLSKSIFASFLRT